MSNQIVKWCDAISHFEDEMELGTYRTLRMIKDEATRLYNENKALREQNENYKQLLKFAEDDLK